MLFTRFVEDYHHGESITFQFIRESKSFYTRYVLRKCSKERFRPFRRSKVPKTIETQNLASIGFQKLDRLLMERLYELSFPLIRKRLWMSSKSTSKLGKKPITYVVNYFVVHGRLLSIPEFQDVVFFCTFLCEFQDLPSADLLKIVRFVDFQNTNTNMRRCEINPKKLPSLFHFNLGSLSLEYCNITFETALNITPQVCLFIFHGNLPENWESLLLKWDNSKLRACVLSPKDITDFNSLSSFIRQTSRIQMSLRGNVKYDETELLKYFLPVEDYPGKVLIFGMIPDANKYKLRQDSCCTII